VIPDSSVANVVRFVPAANGTYFGQTMQARHIYTIAGTEFGSGCIDFPCGDGGLGTDAALDGPYQAVFDSHGNVLFTDTGDAVVRKISRSSGFIYNFAGEDLVRCTSGPCGEGSGIATSGSSLAYPYGLADYGSGFLVADIGESAIRWLEP
jgi:hypothetical protein